MKKLRIATRESALALWQANHVKTVLQKIKPELGIELVGLTTQGDKWLETPLFNMGGKGLFVKELEEALLTNKADIAVHSLKDMLTVLPAGLMLGAIMEREDPRDVFISNKANNYLELPKAAKIGTSSLRRQAQIALLRPDLRTANLRGNVQSRIAKLDSNQFDAIILAAAGIKRLQLENSIRSYFTAEEILPAAGQGAICAECRIDDNSTRELLMQLNHRDTQICTTAERAVVHHLGGSCKAPIAAYAQLNNNTIQLTALVASPDGKKTIKVTQTGFANNAELLGQLAAAQLLTEGAESILAANC